MSRQYGTCGTCGRNVRMRWHRSQGPDHQPPGWLIGKHRSMRAGVDFGEPCHGEGFPAASDTPEPQEER